MNGNLSKWVLKDAKDEGIIIEGPTMSILPIWLASHEKYDK